MAARVNMAMRPVLLMIAVRKDLMGIQSVPSAKYFFIAL